MSKIGRNDPCPCGSGRKHKQCCLDRGAVATLPARPKTPQLIIDDYTGSLPEDLGPDVEPTAEGARVTSPDPRAADRMRARLERLGLVHRERSTFAPDLPEAAPALGMLSFKKEFFVRWLNEPVEKLGGLTPRQAATERRRDLVDLIRALEVREERLPLSERYAFEPIRQELGL